MSAEIIPLLRMDQYPNRIFELRRARGLSQEAVANAIDSTKMSVSRMERGLQPVTFDDARAIARLFGVHMADLLSDEDNPLRLDEEEADLVERIRAGDPEQRENVRRVTEALIPYRPRDEGRSAA